MPAADITVISHPLVQHKLTLMRDVGTTTSKFRTLLREISLLLTYEVCRDLETEMVEITTPLETFMAPRLEGKKLCFVSILRAGNGLQQRNVQRFLSGSADQLRGDVHRSANRSRLLRRDWRLRIQRCSQPERKQSGTDSHGTSLASLSFLPPNRAHP